MTRDSLTYTRLSRLGALRYIDIDASAGSPRARGALSTAEREVGIGAFDLQWPA